MGKITVISESESGRNTKFQVEDRTLSRAKLVKEIEKGLHEEYHVRTINGVKTPVSNPDKNKNNNLG